MPVATRLDRSAVVLRSTGMFTLGLAALVAAVAISVIGWSVRDGRPERAQDPTFTTVASGTVEVPASSATTRIGLRACAAGPGASLQLLNGRYGGMSRAWIAADVPEAAISRGGVATFRESPTRWCSSLDAVATVEDLGLVDAVLAGVARYPRGIEHVTGPTFEYDTARLEEGALDEAMRVARQKADDASERAGTRVVGVQSISEHGASVDRPEDAGDMAFRESSGAAVAATELQRAPTAIGSRSGEATATVTVDAVFRLAA